MRYYFTLQYKMFCRKSSEFGLPPWFAFLLLPFSFFLISKYLFLNTEYAGYLYVAIALGILSRMSDIKRNNFLRLAFHSFTYRKIRIVENLGVMIPFLIFPAYEGQFGLILMAAGLAVAMALIHINTNAGITIPTPFGKIPWEFPTGFRSTFFIFPLAYFMTVMAVRVSNFNLGIFSLSVIALTCMSYYSKPENEYYIWNYSMSARQFILRKMGTGFLFFMLLAIPVLFTLMLFFTDQWIVLSGVSALCLVYLATIILAKYASYPYEMSIPKGLLVAISLMMPPILIAVIPFLWFQADKKLIPLLHDSN